MNTIYHALILNLHQPSGNLEYLLEHKEWEAKEILWALDRIPRSLWEYDDIACVHLSLSGTLLETLSDPGFQSRVYGIARCGELLWQLQNTKLFSLLGTGFYHPVFPLIPKEDIEEHMVRWQGLAKHLFWRDNFPGFWPPEMAFCMEMIPLLKKLGYQYVLVDSNNVTPVDKMDWHETRYRPHIAKYGQDEIIVVVRDRELSNAQESGMDFVWFEHEVNERTKLCDFPPLVTTCTDGDNGGWFRNTDSNSNFWDVFYRDFLQRRRENQTSCSPIFIEEYIRRYGAKGYVTVETGAWNTGWHDGSGFTQWTGSQVQKDALGRIELVSSDFHSLCKKVGLTTENSVRYDLSEAHWHLLKAETSCNFFWGEAWVDRCHKDLDIVCGHMQKVIKVANS